MTSQDNFSRTMKENIEYILFKPLKSISTLPPSLPIGMNTPPSGSTKFSMTESKGVVEAFPSLHTEWLEELGKFKNLQEYNWSNITEYEEKEGSLPPEQIIGLCIFYDKALLHISKNIPKDITRRSFKEDFVKVLVILMYNCLVNCLESVSDQNAQDMERAMGNLETMNNFWLFIVGISRSHPDIVHHQYDTKVIELIHNTLHEMQLLLQGNKYILPSHPLFQLLIYFYFYTLQSLAAIAAYNESKRFGKESAKENIKTILQILVKHSNYVLSNPFYEELFRTPVQLVKERNWVKQGEQNMKHFASQFNHKTMSFVSPEIPPRTKGEEEEEDFIIPERKNVYNMGINININIFYVLEYYIKQLVRLMISLLQLHSDDNIVRVLIDLLKCQVAYASLLQEGKTKAGAPLENEDSRIRIVCWCNEVIQLVKTIMSIFLHFRNWRLLVEKYNFSSIMNQILFKIAQFGLLHRIFEIPLLTQGQTNIQLQISYTSQFDVLAYVIKLISKARNYTKNKFQDSKIRTELDIYSDDMFFEFCTTISEKLSPDTDPFSLLKLYISQYLLATNLENIRTKIGKCLKMIFNKFLQFTENYKRRKQDAFPQSPQSPKSPTSATSTSTFSPFAEQSLALGNNEERKENKVVNENTIIEIMQLECEHNISDFFIKLLKIDPITSKPCMVNLVTNMKNNINKETMLFRYYKFLIRAISNNNQINERNIYEILSRNEITHQESDISTNQIAVSGSQVELLGEVGTNNVEFGVLQTFLDVGGLQFLFDALMKSVQMSHLKIYNSNLKVLKSSIIETQDIHYYERAIEANKETKGDRMFDDLFFTSPKCEKMSKNLILHLQNYPLIVNATLDFHDILNRLAQNIIKLKDSKIFIYQLLKRILAMLKYYPAVSKDEQHKVKLFKIIGGIYNLLRHKNHKIQVIKYLTPLTDILINFLKGKTNCNMKEYQSYIFHSSILACYLDISKSRIGKNTGNLVIALLKLLSQIFVGNSETKSSFVSLKISRDKEIQEHIINLIKREKIKSEEVESILCLIGSIIFERPFSLEKTEKSLIEMPTFVECYFNVFIAHYNKEKERTNAKEAEKLISPFFTAIMASMQKSYYNEIVLSQSNILSPLLKMLRKLQNEQLLIGITSFMGEIFSKNIDAGGFKILFQEFIRIINNQVKYGSSNYSKHLLGSIYKMISNSIVSHKELFYFTKEANSGIRLTTFRLSPGYDGYYFFTNIRLEEDQNISKEQKQMILTLGSPKHKKRIEIYIKSQYIHYAWLDYVNHDKTRYYIFDKQKIEYDKWYFLAIYHMRGKNPKIQIQIDGRIFETNNPKYDVGYQDVEWTHNTLGVSYNPNDSAGLDNGMLKNHFIGQMTTVYFVAVSPKEKRRPWEEETKQLYALRYFHEFILSGKDSIRYIDKNIPKLRPASQYKILDYNPQESKNNFSDRLFLVLSPRFSRPELKAMDRVIALNTQKKYLYNPIKQLFEGTEIFIHSSAIDVLTNLGGIKIFLPILHHLIEANSENDLSKESQAMEICCTLMQLIEFLCQENAQITNFFSITENGIDILNFILEQIAEKYAFNTSILNSMLGVYDCLSSYYPEEELADQFLERILFNMNLWKNKNSQTHVQEQLFKKIERILERYREHGGVKKHKTLHRLWVKAVRILFGEEDMLGVMAGLHKDLVKKRNIHLVGLCNLLLSSEVREERFRMTDTLCGYLKADSNLHDLQQIEYSISILSTIITTNEIEKMLIERETLAFDIIDSLFVRIYRAKGDLTKTVIHPILEEEEGSESESDENKLSDELKLHLSICQREEVSRVQQMTTHFDLLNGKILGITVHMLLSLNWVKILERMTIVEKKKLSMPPPKSMPPLNKQELASTEKKESRQRSVDETGRALSALGGNSPFKFRKGILEVFANAIKNGFKNITGAIGNYIFRDSNHNSLGEFAYFSLLCFSLEIPFLHHDIFLNENFLKKSVRQQLKKKGKTLKIIPSKFQLYIQIIKNMDLWVWEAKLRIVEDLEFLMKNDSIAQYLLSQDIFLTKILDFAEQSSEGSAERESINKCIMGILYHLIRSSRRFPLILREVMGYPQLDAMSIFSSLTKQLIKEEVKRKEESRESGADSLAKTVVGGPNPTIPPEKYKKSPSPIHKSGTVQDMKSSVNLPVQNSHLLKVGAFPQLCYAIEDYLLQNPYYIGGEEVLLLTGRLLLLAHQLDLLYFDYPYLVIFDDKSMQNIYEKPSEAIFQREGGVIRFMLRLLLNLLKLNDNSQLTLLLFKFYIKRHNQDLLSILDHSKLERLKEALRFNAQLPNLISFGGPAQRTQVGVSGVKMKDYFINIERNLMLEDHSLLHQEKLKKLHPIPAEKQLYRIKGFAKLFLITELAHLLIMEIFKIDTYCEIPEDSAERANFLSEFSQNEENLTERFRGIFKLFKDVYFCGETGSNNGLYEEAEAIIKIMRQKCIIYLNNQEINLRTIYSQVESVEPMEDLHRFSLPLKHEDRENQVTVKMSAIEDYIIIDDYIYSVESDGPARRGGRGSKTYNKPTSENKEVEFKLNVEGEGNISGEIGSVEGHNKMASMYKSTIVQFEGNFIDTLIAITETLKIIDEKEKYMKTIYAITSRNFLFSILPFFHLMTTNNFLFIDTEIKKYILAQKGALLPRISSTSSHSSKSMQASTNSQRRTSITTEEICKNIEIRIQAKVKNLLSDPAAEAGFVMIEEEDNLFVGDRCYYLMAKDMESESGLWHMKNAHSLNRKMYIEIKRLYNKLTKGCPMQKKTNKEKNYSKLDLGQLVELSQERDSWGRAMRLKPMKDPLKNAEIKHMYAYIRQYYMKRFFVFNSIKSPEDRAHLLKKGFLQFPFKNDIVHSLCKNLTPKQRHKRVNSFSPMESDFGKTDSPINILIQDKRLSERIKLRMHNLGLKANERNRIQSVDSFNTGISKNSSGTTMSRLSIASGSSSPYTTGLALCPSPVSRIKPPTAPDILEADTQKFNQHSYLFDCEMITLKGAIFGKFYACRWSISFESDKQVLRPKQEQGKDYEFGAIERNQVAMTKQKKWGLWEINEILLRRYNLLRRGIEIYFTNNKSIFISFFSRDDIKLVLDIFSHIKAKYHHQFELIRDPEKYFAERKFKDKWLNFKISNFEYIMALNKYGGRTFCDISQYPVFPWILKKYDFKDTDPRIGGTDKMHIYISTFTPPKPIQSKKGGPEKYPETYKQYKQFFRNLNNSIAGINDEKKKLANQKIENSLTGDDEFKPFMFGTHYLPGRRVLGYLMRLEPYASLLVKFDSGLDCAPRMFHSIVTAWNGVHSLDDNKELIPEFYYLPDFLMNHNKIAFGQKVAESCLRLEEKVKIQVDDVVVAEWARDHHHFIQVMSLSLECLHVSDKINNWIDLIFGHKQQSTDHYNLFKQLCDEETVKRMRKNGELMEGHIYEIAEFGHNPIKLFNSKHPKRSINDYINDHKYVICDQLCFFRDGVYDYVKINSFPSALWQISAFDKRVLIFGEGGMLYKTRHNHYINAKHERAIIFEKGNLSLCPSICPHSICDPMLGNTCQEEGKFIVSGRHLDYTFKIINSITGEVECSRMFHKAMVTCVLAIELPSKGLITASADGVVVLWSWDTLLKKNIQPYYKFFCDHTAEITSIDASYPLDLLITASYDDTCVLRVLSTGQFFKLIHPKVSRANAYFIKMVRLSYRGYFVLVFGPKHNLFLHDVIHVYSINGELIRVIVPDDTVNAIIMDFTGYNIVYIYILCRLLEVINAK